MLPQGRIRILTGKRLAGPTLAALPHFLPEHLLLEPKAKGTAPVLVWAAHTLVRQDPDAIMISLHADHHIAPAQAFRELLLGMAARARVEDLLFTVGAVPDRPETGYGYIQPGAQLAGEPVAHAVARFVEKPDRATAETYVAEGCLWNTGIFVWRAALLLEEVRRHTPEIARHLALLDVDDVIAFFDRVPTLNIDPAVLERSERVAVVPATFAWDDVGTWDAIGRMRTPDASKNVAVGDAHIVDSSDCVAWAEDGSIVVFGARDLLVVRVGNVTFVAPRERAEAIKALLERLPARLRETE
jgi:mannose-1-phosphate guanylyltransferase